MRFGRVTGSVRVVRVNESDGDGVCVGSGYVADGARSVAVALGVVAGVDRFVDPGVGGIKDDLAFDAAGTNTTGAGGQGMTVPRPVLAAGRSDVELVFDANDPHRHVRPQRPVASSRRELYLGDATDVAQLVVGPRAHSEPTRISALMARRSSIAAYASGVPSRSVSKSRTTPGLIVPSRTSSRSSGI